jgi:hypothetical protein
MPGIAYREPCNKGDKVAESDSPGEDHIEIGNS